MPAPVVAATGVTPVDPQGPKPLWSYATAFIVIGALIKLFWRIKYLHADRVPLEGPVILAANHRSLLDPPMVPLGLPVRRAAHFMAKAELFAKEPLRSFLLSMMAFPVHRESADRTAIKQALDILARNGVLGMFPEGTRVTEGETATAQLGVAFIAMKSGATIVPVGLEGTETILRSGKFPSFPPVTISYGEPIDTARFLEMPRSERLAALTSAVMEGIDSARAEAVEYARSR